MTGPDSGTPSDDDPHLDGEGGWRRAAQRHYDPERDRELTTVIVTAVAEAKRVPPAELTSPRLYDCFDAAALERTFFGPDGVGGSPQGVGTVDFRYGDYLVEVWSDGRVRVFEPAPS